MDEYEFEIEGNVNIKGQQSIKKTDSEINHLANSVSQAEEVTRKLNQALNAMKVSGIKPNIDLKEIEKVIQSIEKRVDIALDSSLNMFSKNVAETLSSQHVIRSSEGFKNKAEGLLARERENDRQAGIRYQRMMANVRSMNKSWNSFNPVHDEISSHQNQRRSNVTSMIQRTVTLENKLADANKAFDKFSDTLVNDFEKKVQKLEKYRQDVRAGFTLGTSGPVMSAGAAMKQEFLARKNANTSAPLLLTSDAGVLKEVKETLAAEKKIKEAKEKEAEAAEESADTQEKIAKKRKMTEYQENKIQVAKDKNKIYEERVGKLEDQTSERYQARQDKIAEARMLNAKANQAGSLLKDPRYQTGRAFSSVGNAISGFGAGGRALGLIFDSIGTLIKSPVAGTATAVTNLVKGISELGKSAVQAFSEIEAIKVQLGVVFSNQTQANSMFGEIAHYAVKSPFGVQQASELAVLLKQSGVYASDLMNTLKMLGDTAGGNMEKMKRIANNYAQIVSIGKASMLDMRQFAYAGIPIFEAVSKELNVSQHELRKLISDGKVTSDIIEKVFKDLTGINGIFENATEKGAKTLKARLQNLSDAKQLAMASIGERITSYGIDTGNDSYANNMVTTVEKIYQWLYDKVNTKNIEKSVAAIEKRDLRIQELQKVMDSYADNPRMLSLFTRALGVELDKINADSDRAIYEASYQSKTQISQNTPKEFGVRNLEELKLLSNIINRDTKGYYESRNAHWVEDSISAQKAFQDLSIAMKELEMSEKDIEEIYSLSRDEFNKLADSITEAVRKMESLRELTELEIKYHLETNLLSAQQLAFDQENKRADQTSSLNSKFQDLLELYKGSDEYKKKEEEKRVETLKQAQEILKKLSAKAGENGLVDITKFGVAEFINYDKQGAFSAARKLNVVNGKNASLINADADLLKKQFGYAIKETINYFNNAGDTKTATTLTGAISALNQNLSNSEYLDKFSGVMNNIQHIIENSTLEDSVKQMYQNFLYASMLQHELTIGGENAKPEDLVKNKQNFIPLWKRILSSATGLSTTGMVTTAQTLTNYRDDMAIRNMASDVLKVTMRSMGVDAAMGLMRAGSAVQLTGDSGKTLQVDWKATRKAIKDFATQLSASTEVITAYKNGLQAELDVYEQLVAAGYTQAESMDLGSQKFVSSKQLAKLGLGNQSQLVNAFGEVIETASGKKYSVEDIKFINGEMYDSLGNKIEEEVVVTGNLFEFIKGELPRLRKELSEAGIAELNNTLMKELHDKAATTSYSQRYLYQNGYSENTALALQNPEYISKYLDIKMTELKAGNSNLKNLSNSDIYMTAMAYQKRSAKIEAEIRQLEEDIKTTPSAIDDYDERAAGIRLLESELDTLREYVEIANKAFRDMDTDLSKITNNPNAKAVLEKIGTQNIDEAVLKAYLLNAQRNKWGITDPNNIKPRDYGGLRGFRNRMQGIFAGEDIAYDREDFIAETMRANKKKYGLSEDDLKKSNSELAKMLSLSEQIAITWDKGANDIVAALDKLDYSIGSAITQFTSSSLTSTFATLGEVAGEWGFNMQASAKASEALEANFRKLGASLASNLGTMITEAGLSMAIHASSGAEVLAGLGLAAAGGVASWIGGYLNVDKSSKNKEDNEAKKLESLADQLRELLAQARSDALYYEKNLRHKTALGLNEQFSYKSVNDAIITPKGVVMTHPQDYLIATKTPQAMGNNTVVQPNISFNVIDNVGVNVRQEQKTNPDGSIEIVAILENAMADYIASSKSDDAFNARNYRLNNRSAIM